jgi:hypothetical protein
VLIPVAVLTGPPALALITAAAAADQIDLVKTA